jgi:hypothetical protein
MKRWLRWQWYGPRAAMVVVAVMGLQYVLGNIVKSVAERNGKSIVGATLSVEHAQVSLAKRQICLSGLTVGNPDIAGEPCLSADYCELVVEVQPLFARKLTVDSGRAHGVRFHGDCKTDAANGAARCRFAPDCDVNATRALLAGIGDRFDSKITEQLESVRLAAKLQANLSIAARELEAQTVTLRAKADELQRQAEAAESNRLRHDAFLDELSSKLKTLQETYDALSAEYEAMPQVLEADRRTIVAARRQDEQILRERLKFEPLDKEAITAYLLRGQVATSIEQCGEWLRCVRRFAECQSPDFVIRSLRLQGTADIFGQPTEVRGLLTGLTRPSVQGGEPIRLRLKTFGTQPVQLRASFAGERAKACDELFVDCREISLPAVTLGATDELRLKLEPSVGSMSVSMRVEAGKLTGDLQVVQRGTKIVATLGGKLGEAPIASPLQQALGEVNSLATHVVLEGTPDAPTCKLWSNLGPTVAEAMNRALLKGADEHLTAVLVQSRRDVDERLAGLERYVAQQQAKFVAETGGFQQKLERIARQQTRGERISIERLGRRLPNNSLFR